MNELGWAAYGGIFGATALMSLVLVPIALRFATRRHVLDHPGGYKQQAEPVPYLGGVAIVVAFAVVVVGAAAARPPVSGFEELAATLGLAVLLSIVGLVDDLRGLGPFVRLAFQLAAALVLVTGGFGVVLFGEPWADGAVTVLWIVGVTNAFNLLDNMDGLSAGIAAIAAASFFLIAAVNGQFLVAALAAALAGCAVGFLRHNRHPARIYMGDAGSLFLGFMIAMIGVKLRFDAPLQVTVFVPIVVLAVPLVDTALVSVTRIMRGRSPFAGGRDHLSHRLVRLGFPVRSAVWLLYAIAFGCGWLGLVMSRLDVGTAYLLLGFVGSLAIVLAVAAARVRVEDAPARPAVAAAPPRRSELEPDEASPAGTASAVRQ